MTPTEDPAKQLAAENVGQEAEMATYKSRSIRMTCPSNLVWQWVQEYLDSSDWKTTGVNLGNGTVSAKRKGLMANGLTIEAQVQPGGPLAPTETMVQVVAGFEKGKFDVASLGNKAIDKFEAFLAERLQDASSTGETGANQWRPSI